MLSTQTEIFMLTFTECVYSKESFMFTKENFKEIYEKEIEELSLVESAIDKLGFQMNGKSDVHKNVLSAFEHYANSHSFVNDGNSDKLYYGYVANKVVE